MTNHHTCLQGKPLHRVVKGGWLQAGDIEPPHSGAGGFSIYGGKFADESFALTHDEPGMVGMSNHGEPLAFVTAES